ncbi:unnamed protein product, partial [Discosporangium mesarthrocarpum]
GAGAGAGGAAQDMRVRGAGLAEGVLALAHALGGPPGNRALTTEESLEPGVGEVAPGLQGMLEALGKRLTEGTMTQEEWSACLGHDS